MKHLTGSFLFCVLTGLSLYPVYSQQDTALSRLIDSLAIEDQRYRNRHTELENQPVPDSAALRETSFMMRQTDSLNLVACKEIFLQYGFPGVDRVGEERAHRFWLLIQHCDHDPVFQEKVLAKMKEEVDKKNANARDYAYLIDRVLVNHDKPQIYGTQMQLNRDSTSYEPKPLVEPEYVDARRKEMGMGPIEWYIQTMNSRYFGTLKKKN